MSLEGNAVEEDSDTEVLLKDSETVASCQNKSLRVP